MPGTLFVVATPIGNLEDITLRALRVLREVALIAAEDTRRTAKLLAHHAIPTRTISFHEHNTRSRVPTLLARLEAGESVALVSDAGTPGVSDPGVELVRGCVERGIPVDPVPGVSAPLAAAVASGFPLEPLTVFGFPPARAKDRTAWLEAINKIPWTSTFFEAPHRMADTLRLAGSVFGDRPICVGRELTKVHQEFLRGTASEVAERLTAPRGEFTIVLGPSILVDDQTHQLPEGRALLEELGVMTDTGVLTRGEAISALAKRLGRPRREVYAALEDAKRSGE